MLHFTTALPLDEDSATLCGRRIGNVIAEGDDVTADLAAKFDLGCDECKAGAFDIAEE